MMEPISELESRLKTHPLPRHIGVIMDGNGRWAEGRGQSRVDGHREGSNSVREVTRSARRIGVEALTLYAFSAQNWSRPPEEVAALMNLLREYLLKEREEITIFMTTHYMDEAEFCDRIAIMDRGEIVVLDTPAALKASVGADRVALGTADDDAAIKELAGFGIEASVAEGAVTFHVPNGGEFVPRLFAELDTLITSVAVSRPTLDDVFMRYTGTTIRDAETLGPGDGGRAMMRALAGARR